MMNGGQFVTLDNAAGPRGMAIYAIGDVHGRMDLLARMLDRIDDEIARNAPSDWRIVLLGDLVDRGPWSRQVIDCLLARAADPRHVFLAGNHDSGFLAFLERMEARGTFLAFGGVATAASYGVALDAPLADAHAALVAAVPDTHRRFLRELKPSLHLGDYFFCHAGIRPGIRLEAQSVDDLQWIRSPFLEYRYPHPAIVVHGHTPCAAPEFCSNRINVDTGAFRSGLLTALVIEEESRRLLQVVED